MIFGGFVGIKSRSCGEKLAGRLAGKSQETWGRSGFLKMNLGDLKRFEALKIAGSSPIKEVN